MGEYMIVVNLDKCEELAIPPYRFSEQICNLAAPLALYVLLTVPTPEEARGLGWGDIGSLKKFLGRWAGDRILVYGDNNTLVDEMVAQRCKGRLRSIGEELERAVLEYARRECGLSL